jgi:predicted RNA-binding protein
MLMIVKIKRLNETLRELVEMVMAVDAVFEMLYAL